jgi:hypothetical protein
MLYSLTLARTHATYARLARSILNSGLDHHILIIEQVDISGLELLCARVD